MILKIKEVICKLSYKAQGNKVQFKPCVFNQRSIFLFYCNRIKCRKKFSQK